MLPLSGTNTDSSFIIEGQDPKAKARIPDEEIRDITPDYFPCACRRRCSKAVSLARLTRPIRPLVVIVNQAFAKKYFPNGEALGKRISMGRHKSEVGDDRRSCSRHTTSRLWIRKRSQSTTSRTRRAPIAMMYWRCGVRKTRAHLSAAIRQEFRNIDPDIPLANVRTFDAVMADSIAPRRLSVVLLSAFSGVALLLASVGMYGVMSFLGCSAHTRDRRAHGSRRAAFGCFKNGDWPRARS